MMQDWGLCMSFSLFFCDYVYRYVFEEDHKQLQKFVTTDRSNLRRDLRYILEGKDSPRIMELLMEACIDRKVDIGLITRLYQSRKGQTDTPCCSYIYVHTRVDILISDHAEFAEIVQGSTSVYEHLRQVHGHIKRVDCGENSLHIAKCPMYTTAPISEPADELLADCACRRLELLITSISVWRLERIDA